MSNIPHRATAQASSASSTPNVIVVAGVKARDKWMKHLCEVGGTMQPLEFRTAMRLGLYLNCTTGQCNPLFSKLARAVGAEPGSVKKVCRSLKEGGWIRRSDDGNFELLLPAAEVSSGDTSRNQVKVSQKATRGVQNPGVGVSAADSLMNTENNEQSAAPPRAARLVDTPVSADRAEVPLDDEDVIFEDSAPDGAVAPISQKDAYNALVDVYEVDFKDYTEDDAEHLLHRMLLDGENIEEILLAARGYMRQVTQNGGGVMMVLDWLEATPWRRSCS